MANDIFLGRQPILDRDRRTFGYELLYRDGPDRATFFDDPDDATRGVMERALLHWGMEQIIGDRFGFINASPSLIFSGFHLAMPPEGIIFEISARESFDAPTLTALQAARGAGYHFALDNVMTAEQLEGSRLLHHVSIVKVQLTDADQDLARIVEVVRNEVPGALLAAERVETLDDFDRCNAIGFDLFQGYFFSQPEVLRRSARPASSISALALMAEMQKSDVGIERTEELVGSDPSLAYRLLSVVNSSAFGLDRRVDSIRHAIVLLGLNQIRHLAALVALSSTDAANETLIHIGTVRARLASSLSSDRDKSSAFTVGLLSITDAIFQTPMEELVSELPISDDIAAALVDESGVLGETLRAVKACENADLDVLATLNRGNAEDLLKDYGDAIQWADRLRLDLSVRRTTTKLKLRTDSPPTLATT